ncbi:hypothetical protein Patl1_25922 [Pistacia atlantica]|uniref:Uncharacterized protein n=1 Tax=Pistacia atlantica TaxID=434234 RepID=A0ACC1B401_9ROSI|nr:hypothetical protein Patl1_25922 [Pistacia atlantica]
MISSCKTREPRKSSVDVMDKDEEAIKKKIVVKALPFRKLLSYADGVDWLLMVLGTFGSVVHGMALPIGYLLLGKALDAFGNNLGDKGETVKALKKVIPFVWYMAFATFPAGIAAWMAFTCVLLFTTEIGCWMYASERQLTRMRLAYLKAVLNQEIGAFDTDLTSGKIITGVSNHMSVIQDAIGEKVISQIKTVFAFVGENSAIKSFSEGMDRQIFISKGEALIKGVGVGMIQSVTFCCWALVIWIGAVVVLAGRATGGDVLAAVMSILFGAVALTYAAPDIQIFNQAKAAGFEIFQVIERKPIICYDSKGRTLEKVDGYIDIRDVTFAYPSRPDQLILDGFSLSIPAGKMVALVGEILIDNNNIKDLDLKFLRENIGAVSQEPSLFAGTLKDNIRVGNMHATDEDIQKAAVMANAHTFISDLPDQYLTELGQRGVQLSGGQKQRIAIARAILKNPPILLLDEATSALDSESEKLVQEALENAMKGRTVILIAHRMSTIINADIISIVENGQVAETGTHHSLLDTSKFYSRIISHAEP